MAEPAGLRLLLVTRNLPPLVGGMERLNWHMANELACDAEVRIVAPEDSAACAPVGMVVDGVPLRPLWRFLVAAKWRASRVARQWKPNVVLAGSGLTAPAAWLAARLSGARAAAYVHGLDITVGNRIYRWLWLPFVRRMDRIIANSRATAGLAIAAGVDPHRIAIVHPGVELPGTGTAPDAAAFRQRHGLGDGPVLLSVGRLTERKGLREFVAEVFPSIVERYADAMLVVVGDAAADALAARSQSRESIQSAADAAGVGANVRFLGKVPDAELEAAFAVASVHVFPVRELPGDPEGFGMVAVEAAARGVPTVAFACGGVVDAVSDGASGWLVAPGDASRFAKRVLEAVNGDAAQVSPRSCRQFAEGKTWRVFGTKIRVALLDARNAP